MQFSAKQAREIMESRDDWNAQLWYGKFNEHLFQLIKDQSLKGNNSITIDSVLWDEEDSKKNFLKSMLLSLGYSVLIENNVMIVSW